MSEVVARILRAAGDISRPALQAVVFAADPARGAALVDRLTAKGGKPCLAGDAQAAVDLLAGESDYNALVVDAHIARNEVEALAARANALRPASACLAVIHLAEGGSDLIGPAINLPPNLLLQTVVSSDLNSALDLAERSVALAAADVQRQVEIIARAVIRLGQRLHNLSHESPSAIEADEPEAVGEDQDGAFDSAEAIASLRRLIRSRRLRERFFQDARFGEPAWDILLDLSLAWFEDKAVSVSSVCIASGVPMSTAMRWINEMVDAGLIDRWIDPTDGRRNLVQIAPATRQAMLRYLAALNRSERAGTTATAPADSPKAG